jgi:hypothetical protein
MTGGKDMLQVHQRHGARNSSLIEAWGHLDDTRLTAQVVHGEWRVEWREMRRNGRNVTSRRAAGEVVKRLFIRNTPKTIKSNQVKASAK